MEGKENKPLRKTADHNNETLKSNSRKNKRRRTNNVVKQEIDLDEPQEPIKSEPRRNEEEKGYEEDQNVQMVDDEEENIDTSNRGKISLPLKLINKPY
jgi:hypothetical protein